MQILWLSWQIAWWPRLKTAALLETAGVSVLIKGNVNLCQQLIFESQVISRLAYAFKFFDVIVGKYFADQALFYAAL